MICINNSLEDKREKELRTSPYTQGNKVRDSKKPAWQACGLVAKTAAIYKQSTNPLRASQLSFTPRPLLSDTAGHDPPSHLFDLTLLHAWSHWPSSRPLSIFRSFAPTRSPVWRPQPQPSESGPFSPSRDPLCMLPPRRGPRCWSDSRRKRIGLFCSSQSPQGLAHSLRWFSKKKFVIE